MEGLRISEIAVRAMKVEEAPEVCTDCDRSAVVGTPTGSQSRDR